MDLYIAKILSYVCFQMDFAEIDRLLGAAWLGAALICVAAALPIKALHPLRSLVLACCRRGKLLYSSSSSSKRFTVPQSFFTHFYVVGVTWNTLLLATATLSSCMCTLSSATDGIQFSALVEQFTGAGASAGSGSIPSMAKQKQRGWTVVLLLLLMELQVCRRLYESLMVLSYGPDARMHLLGYLVGLFSTLAVLPRNRRDHDQHSRHGLTGPVTEFVRLEPRHAVVGMFPLLAMEAELVPVAGCATLSMGVVPPVQVPSDLGLALERRRVRRRQNVRDTIWGLV
ncbi:polyprenol reductase 2 isoform X3 [Selaginella moellendorffii]|uniref:polyprenol reductase 2 isoform X3 n=1 Tax=Selaginella moellendorffii TaxID=88036 RepID=UPI000D1C43FF|nr:polyprenol reductase 2 isoform X3 [Selaginella moellendorffii]|eukprot:XP_024528093.1 polyprenol reductase 2 isoform X3 [Selaginella moellendorffii]